jgi:hypothetical protein
MNDSLVIHCKLSSLLFVWCPPWTFAQWIGNLDVHQLWQTQSYMYMYRCVYAIFRGREHMHRFQLGVNRVRVIDM